MLGSPGKIQSTQLNLNFRYTTNTCISVRISNELGCHAFLLAKPGPPGGGARVALAPGLFQSEGASQESSFKGTGGR